MKPVDVLRRAREKIAAPERWCRHLAARDQLGAACGPSDPDAVSWCALGAIEAVGDKSAATRIAVERLRDVIPSHATRAGLGGVSVFNDCSWVYHEDVLALFDRAIGLAEKEES